MDALQQLYQCHQWSFDEKLIRTHLVIRSHGEISMTHKTLTDFWSLIFVVFFLDFFITNLKYKFFMVPIEWKIDVNTFWSMFHFGIFFLLIFKDFSYYKFFQNFFCLQEGVSQERLHFYVKKTFFYLSKFQ